MYGYLYGFIWTFQTRDERLVRKEAKSSTLPLFHFPSQCHFCQIFLGHFFISFSVTFYLIGTFSFLALFLFYHFFLFLALFLVFLTCSLSLVYFIIYYVYLQRRQRFCTTSGNFPSYHLLYLSLFSHHVSLSVTFHPPCDRSSKRASTVLT